MQKYEKTVRDNYNDPATVSVPQRGGLVNLKITDTESSAAEHSWAELTPAAARKLARYLKRAANVAEGKPAKTPKPAPEILETRSGVRLHRNADGTYSTTDCDPRGCVYPDRHLNVSLSRILAEGGRAIS